MEKAFKKIIAKEILILFGFIVFIPLFYGGFYLKNFYYKIKTDNLADETEALDPYHSKLRKKFLLRFEFASANKDLFEGIYSITPDDFDKIDLIVKQAAFEEYEIIERLYKPPNFEEITNDNLFDDFPSQVDEEKLTTKNSNPPQNFNPKEDFVEIPNEPVLKRKNSDYDLTGHYHTDLVPEFLLLSKSEQINFNPKIRDYLYKKNERIKTSYKITPFRKMTPYLMWWLIILSSIAYPLRGIYFLLKWAIKTVKS